MRASSAKTISPGPVGATLAAVAASVRRVIPAPAGNSYYVALGSSFAAGLGLGRRAPGSPIVSQRTTNGYPQQLARSLKVPSFTDMTSSGSTVRHVLDGGQAMLGPQIDALGPDTRLVTLTAGGNDIRYVGDLVAMAYRNRGGVVGAIVGAFWKGAAAAADRDFASLDANLRATLRAIERRSPSARVVVATYPSIVPEAGICPALGITDREARLMREVGDRLAETTRNVATAEGATLVDMAALSKDHHACSREPWVNGSRPAVGVAFHPTLIGASATADAIEKALS